ncbi:LLM class flavin-dependent oxidoreductase [Streptomyces fuscichromogenes]|uniref:LLM class flavin-dependent oxidoreductase n=1 Tax=Streptomyces fuscichromogenes TaxID=1324013 RepID=UPI001670F8F2|nr:LLM class flavin-dependent oxidoreductase [Streptomyces fuscichromogenes]
MTGPAPGVRGRVVIVGGGHAGATLAGLLRRGGHQGEVLLLGDETDFPYQRPPLSKGVVICAIADDTATARREAAAQIAFYVAPKAYGPVMEASGFGAEAAAVQAAFRAGDHQSMIAAVSDKMLDRMAVAGTVDEVRDALPVIERRYDHAALYSPSFTVPPERVAENTEAIIETFGRRDPLSSPRSRDTIASRVQNLHRSDR